MTRAHHQIVRVHAPSHIALALVALLGAAASQAQRPDTAGASVDSFVERFDSWPLRDAWRGEMQDTSRVRIVARPVRAGIGALEVTLRPGDIAARRNRTELVLARRDGLESEVWYAWSVLVPAEYHDDRENARFQIMGQFHVAPDHAAGETWENYRGYPPMLSIQYGYDDSGSGFGLFYGLGRDRARVAIHYIEKGRWYDIVLHVRWSRTAHGFVEAWIDGHPWTPSSERDNRVYGANMYNAVPAYLKLGLYRDFGFESIHRLYYDELRIGGRREDVVLPGRQ